MLIGVPKEIKNHEYRVGLTPSSVKELVKHGHQVMIEHNAGVAIDFTNEEYVAAGAEIAVSLREEDHGGKSFSCRDLEGHLWTFGSYNPWRQ